MIKAVIFDIGNVLTDFGWQAMYREKGLGGETFERVARATVQSTFWCELDRGVMTFDEVMDSFVSLDKEMEDEIRRVLADTHGIVTGRAYAVPWVCSLKKLGLKVYVLSNFSEKIWNDCKDALEFYEYTDGGIISYREHLIKPDPAIYELLLKRYGLKPEECVFIDDLKENVDVAITLGVHGIVFNTFAQAKEELNTLLKN